MTFTTESEFTAFVVALVDRKVKGQLLTATIGEYRVQIAGAEGTFRIAVSGLGKWTRRQGTSKHNVASVAATLYAELNQGAEQAEAPAEEITEVQAARNAVTEAANAQRLYGQNGIPAIKARTAAREAIYRALRAGATERDIFALQAA